VPVSRTMNAPGRLLVKAGVVVRPRDPVRVAPSRYHCPRIPISVTTAWDAGSPFTESRVIDPVTEPTRGAVLICVLAAPGTRRGGVAATAAPVMRLTGPATRRSTLGNALADGGPVPDASADDVPSVAGEVGVGSLA
jgi:hypothetical protein